MIDPVYVLDTNVFIEAKNRYYAFDIAPGFWDGLIQQEGLGRIESIDRVQDELNKGKDELKKWANNQFSHAFHPSTEADVISAYSRIITWVQNNPQFMSAAKAEFAACADGWLIAYAMVKRRVVVTHEELKPAIRIKVPIPNVCQQFGVPYVDTFAMLRDLGIRLS